MKRATIYAVWHGKGGVGKTTTTHYTATHLAEGGRRVTKGDDNRIMA